MSYHQDHQAADDPFAQTFTAVRTARGESAAWAWVAAVIVGESWARDLSTLIEVRSELDQIIKKQIVNDRLQEPMPHDKGKSSRMCAYR